MLLLSFSPCGGASLAPCVGTFSAAAVALLPSTCGLLALSHVAPLPRSRLRLSPIWRRIHVCLFSPSCYLISLRLLIHPFTFATFPLHRCLIFFACGGFGSTARLSVPQRPLLGVAGRVLSAPLARLGLLCFFTFSSFFLFFSPFSLFDFFLLVSSAIKGLLLTVLLLFLITF